MRETYAITCTCCREMQIVRTTPEDIAAWEAGENIQKAMPYLTAAERELLISGTCGACWDELFPPEDDDD